MSLLANSNAIESGGYNIDRSLRFRSSASAYLNRTPASAGNRKTWTWSGWVKRGRLATALTYLYRVDSTNTDRCEFDSSDRLMVQQNDTTIRVSTQVFRDPSAWYHIVIAMDTTQATANNRTRVYVNGSEITSWTTQTNNAQNTDGNINSTNNHKFFGAGNTSEAFDGFIAELNFIDGQALTPSSFGQTDPVTGVWTPKKYTGTYGTNGFYLPFSDNTSATTLCYDMSGSSTTVSSAAYFTPTGGVSQSGIVFQSGTTIANFYNGITTDLITYNIPVNGYLMLDAGSGNTLNLTKWGFYIRNASSNETWSIQYSSDGTSWSNATTGWSPSSAGWNDVTFSSVGAYRYWRAIVTTQVNGEYYTEYRVYGTGTYRNANDWTPNNISTTAGATYDSMTDVPTLTSATAANFAVMNPLDVLSSASVRTISNGNLDCSVSGNWNGGATIAVSSGAYYCEFTPTSNFDAALGIDDTLGNVATFYRKDGTRWNGSAWVAYGAAYTTNDIIGMAFDKTNATVTFYKNNVSQGQITSVAFSSLARPFFYGVSGLTFNVNFGQRPFSYSPPTGFKALNTFNLPDPVIKKPNQYMDATIYTGNGSTLTVTNSGSMQPDLVWVKDRTTAYNHNLIDSVRGGTKVLRSSSTDAESTETNGISSFNSNGYTVGTLASANSNGDAYVAWQWKESATAGFDIVTYTGNGANRTIAHNLGVAPKMMIVKNRSGVYDWRVYVESIGAGNILLLNTTAASTASSTSWNSTAPTSSVFSIGTAAGVNNNGDNFVAYLFAEIAGFSKFGSYTGNGSTDGPFVYCGFRPKFILCKDSSNAGDWLMIDTSRSQYNVTAASLLAQSSASEYTNTEMDVVSNGFKFRQNAAGSWANNSGQTYIFAAFAENPFKYSNAR